MFIFGALCLIIGGPLAILTLGSLLLAQSLWELLATLRRRGELRDQLQWSLSGGRRSGSAANGVDCIVSHFIYG